MKTYLVTKEDIERLRCNLDSGGDEVYWYISQLDNWEETLTDVEENNTPFVINLPEDFYTNRAKYFALLELENPRKKE